MKKCIPVLFAFLVLFNTESSFSQGLKSIIAIDDNNVIAAGNYGKIIRSSNGGITWTRYTIGTVDFNCADAFGNDVWLGGSDGKVYKTTGVNSPLTGYSTGMTNITCISFYSSAGGFACGNAGRIYRTIDGGLTWHLRNEGIPGSNLVFNAIDFLDGANGLVTGNNGALFITRSGGSNWLDYGPGTTKNLRSAKFLSTYNAFITGDGGVIRQFNGNPLFTTIKSRTTSDIRAISGTGANDIHIVGGGGFIRNNKNGSTEFMNFETNPMMGDISSISYLNETTGYAVSSSNDAIIKTTNGGQSWFYTAGASMNISWVSKLSASNGIGNTLCLHPADRNVLFVVYGKTIYRSFNRGDTWTNIGTVGSSSGTVTYAHSFYVSPVDTNILICAIEGTPTDKVVRSTNYGVTWTTIVSQNFSNYGAPLELDQNSPGVYYFAPEGGQFLKSTNNGASFNVIGFYPFRSPCDVIVEWGNSNNIMVTDGVTSASTPADIFKSTDGGTGWVKVHTNSGGSGLSEIPSICNTVFNPQLAFCTNWSGPDRYKTTNGGDNWSAIAPTTFSGWASDICHEDPTLIITGNYGQNSSLSTNAGANWTSYSMPSGGCGAGMIAPERNYLIAQQCSGLLKMQINYIVDYIEEEIISTNIPANYNLYQNYPNPFNPSTEIKYDVLKSGMVTIKVYDETGKQVKTIVNSSKNPGTHSVRFDASSLSSGMYYYVLETGGIVLSKKMVLVK